MISDTFTFVIVNIKVERLLSRTSSQRFFHTTQFRAARSLVLTTGQDDVYDIDGQATTIGYDGEYYGQDGHYYSVAFSYTDNNDGTTTDERTGLTWQTISFDEYMTWSEAAQYCENLELAGYSDWRLPTAKELFSLSNFSNSFSAIDTNYFTIDNLSSDALFWASDIVKNEAVSVNHTTGQVENYIVSNNETNYVRAVRGEQYLINDFSNNGDGTITDAATGLMWTEFDLGVDVDWETALLLAQQSTFAGYNDWRLPDIKELQSIVSYNNDLAIDTSYFNCTNYSYWSNTSASVVATEYSYAWYIDYITGNIDYAKKYNLQEEDNTVKAVRLVRQ